MDAAAYRAQAVMAQRWIERASDEYVSKAELRRLALGALATLEIAYTAMAERAEQEAAAASGLLVMPTEEGIVTP